MEEFKCHFPGEPPVKTCGAAVFPNIRPCWKGFSMFFLRNALEDIERVQKVDDHDAAPHCECGSSPGEAVAEGGTH